LKRLKEANEYAKSLLREQPDANDAYVAMGSANYIIGSLSGGARFMLWFGGIHGDKKLGMEQLGKTIDGGRYLQPFAKILLALAARRENRTSCAETPARTERRVSGKLALTPREYAKAMGRIIPAQMHPKIGPPAKVHFEKDIKFPPDGLESRCCRKNDTPAIRARR